MIFKHLLSMIRSKLQTSSSSVLLRPSLGGNSRTEGISRSFIPWSPSSKKMEFVEWDNHLHKLSKLSWISPAMRTIKLYRLCFFNVSQNYNAFMMITYVVGRLVHVFELARDYWRKLGPCPWNKNSEEKVHKETAMRLCSRRRKKGHLCLWKGQWLPFLIHFKNPRST